MSTTAQKAPAKKAAPKPEPKPAEDKPLLVQHVVTYPDGAQVSEHAIVTEVNGRKANVVSLTTGDVHPVDLDQVNVLR